jgi:hypothetical protein
MLFMISSDMLGLERLARLFPIRTGVTVPSWVVLNGDSDHIGAAGIRGAGYAVHLVCPTWSSVFMMYVQRLGSRLEME